METDQDEKEYPAFLTNRGVSQHVDALMYANEMNQFNHMSNRMQYDYLFRVVRKHKRPFKSWPKGPKDEDVKLVMKNYNYSERKARDVLHSFPSIVEHIKNV